MVETRDIEDIYPLSPLQEGLLFHTLEPGQGGLYATQITCCLRGLDVPAFEKAWRTVVNRHPSLRSAFVWKSTQRPLQAVARKVGLPFRHEDWRGLGPAELEARLRSFLAEDRRRELPPSRAPLMRLTLFRTGEDTHQLVWTSHHLILDGWCRAPILQEIFTLYQAYVQGRDAELLPVRPYRDYIAWLQAQDLTEVERFWRSKLQGVVERTPVYAVPAGQGDGIGEQEVTLSAPVVSSLRSLARRHRLTPGTIVHGAWALLLFRYSGRRDVVFGTVVSGRPPSLEDAASIIGLFANTLPVRVRAEDTTNAADWLRSVQEELVNQRQYEHSPLAQVQKWSELAPGEPLFDTLVVFQNYPGADVLAQLVHGLGIEDIRSFEQASYPLTLVVIPGPVWRLQLGYDRQRFSDVAVTRMLDHYRRLLEGLTTEIDRPLLDLSLLAESELAQLLREWNDTDAPSALRFLPVHELIAARAAAEPESLAVIWDGGAWSYRTLDCRVNQLARHLRLLGVGPESVVGVLAAGRPVELLLGILAVLKAGGAFLPLDSAHPAERVAYMLADAGCRILLTWGVAADTYVTEGVRRVDLERDGEEIARQSPESPEVMADPMLLAYIFYTSGSTGRPKGVAVSHGAFLSFAVEMARRLRLTSADRMLQFASPAFDVLVEELFPVWLRGGAVILVPPETLGTPRRLGEAMSRLGVTVAELPAVYWHQWADELVSGGGVLPRSLRLLLLGAEKPSPERLAQWRRFSVPLIYVFGLTETAVTSTLFEVPAEHEGELPIGRPVANTRLYVLDREGQPVPVGVPGELFLSGEGLARGYLGLPGLTAERFVPDPWTGSSGGRLYRTGDLARHRLDGNLDFLGRIDDQVKVRGFRIEPGEIEASLLHHPDVREAVVVVREDHPGDRRLVGYFVAAGRPVSARELRAFLAERLPDHMVPSAFIELASLPVNANGKVDRRSLPAPEPARMVEEERFEEPRTETEKLLAKIWQSVLGIAKVGIHDSFFELGGDSILSIRVASAAHRLGWELAPWQLFQYKTIAGLAQILVERRGAALSEEPPASGPVPLTPIQHWFFERSLREPQHWNMPVLLELREPVAPEILEPVLARLIERHDALRLRFLRQADGWRQEVVATAAGTRLLGRIDLSALAEEPRRQALEQAAGLLQGGLDLAVAPLLRAAWLDLGAAGARLLLVAHHLVVDGVSWRLLADDLETGCLQIRRGEPLDLPPATTPFVRWAERLAAYARSGALNGELEYWCSRLAAPPAPLPVDFAGGANSEAAARSLTVSLGADETRSLLQEVPRAYRAQINDLLLVALLHALRGWTGDRRLLVDLEGHGREDLFAEVDLSRTIGWFTTLTPLLLELPEVGGPGNDLRSVKEQLRSIPGHGIGYGLLRYLGEEAAADLRSLPQPEVLFNYMGQIGTPAHQPATFALASEPIGPAVSPRDERTHLLEINARVQDGRLEVRWTWSERVHRRATIEALAESFVMHLRTLTAHCLFSGERGYTPSDFPLAGVDAAALERLAAVAGGVIEDLYSLSPMQQGMLFHTLFEPGEGVYIAQFVFELQESLDVAALRSAWEEVVRRHPVLRTAFFWEDLNDPLQAIIQPVELPWSEEDWSALPEPQQIEELDGYLAADRAQDFVLSRAPLLRLARLRTGATRSWLVLSLHQILLDGWSLPLLFEDLFSLYGAAVRGADARLEGRPPYRRYIEWLRRQDLGMAEEYWRGALRGFASPTPLGLDSPEAETAAEGQGEVRMLLSRDATERLLALARERQLTSSVLVQGALALLLSRYSGEEDVVFGAVVSGRPAELPGVESMIGLFINTLPVRVRVSPLEPLPSWLEGLQRQQIEMHRYEHTPLVDVQRWSEVPAGQPLFSSLLIFQNYPLDRELGQQTGGLGIRKLHSSDQTNYPLTIIVQPGAELHVTALYARRRFHGSAVQRLLEHLGALLEGFATAAVPRLLDLALLSAAERHQLLLEWNDSRTADADDIPLHQLFRIQAAKTPDVVAVTFDSEQLSYRELDYRSDLLAAHLLRMGIEPGEPVGICLERSLEMMIGLLGIMKAGRAYLPLDPEYPVLRIATLIRNAQIQVAVASGHPADPPVLKDLRVVRIDADWPVIALGGKALPVDVSPNSPAYVIYTSGSTGEPKGAVNAHRAICNRIRWMQETYRLTETDRVLQKTPYGFDVSVWELFWPLVTGARLAMARPGGHRDTAYLRDTIRDLGITTLHFVPSMLQAFLEESGIEDCVSVKRVICSGEALAPDLAARFPRRLRAGLHNLYGPTEAAVDVTFWACSGGDGPKNVPIGRPIANTCIHLLDRCLRPVPCGIPGELYIGGRAVGCGYLGNPALTAERFVPDPFSEEPGARLYRTGDLVRRRPDGALEFLGRLDHQVKIRGFRIELGEIEAVLGQHPGIREAAVVAREERPGRSVLVAYFVPAGSSSPTVPMLRGFLEERLPAPMVPALYVELSALPLSPNGKLDRRALPAPAADVSLRETFAEARTLAEVALAAIWAEVLGVERVGIHDNFFELGGDSILSILVITRAARAGLKLTPKRLFERPTIAQLAAEVEGSSQTAAEQGTVSGEVPLTPIQHWFLEQDQTEAHHFNQSVLLEMKKPIPSASLNRALTAVVAHHDALRLRFFREQRDWRQINAPVEERNVFSSVDLSALRPDDRERAVRGVSEDLQGTLDLSRGPLLRAALFHLGSDVSDRFLMTIHHLAVDAVSWRILLEDLMAAQEQVGRGEPIALPAKTTSFKAWAERLARHAMSDRLQAELDYWLEEARNWPARLPVDFPGGANLAGSFRSVWVTLSADETDALVRSAASAYAVQMHEVLLTALSQTLGRWSGGGAILLDVEGHGREEIFEEIDLSRTVGWFTTIYPLLLDLNAADGPGEALKAVKEQVRRVPGRGLGYGLLRYLGEPQAAGRLRSLPPAGVLFNYLGQIDRGSETSSLFTLSREISGGASPRTVRRHLLGVDGFIAGGTLEVEWSYSQNLYQRSTIQQLADAFASALRAIFDHCRSPEAGGYTPSDFALADLKQQQLDRLARKYQRRSI